MRIVFVSAPPSAGQARHAAVLLEQAIQQLCLQQPGYECIVLQGNELPGMFAFGQRRKQKQDIIDLKPDVVIYASPANLLLIDKLPIMAVLTAGAEARVNTLAGKLAPKLAGFITDSAALKKELSRSLEIPAECIDVLPLFEEITIDASGDDIRDEHTLGKEYFFYSGQINAESQWERVLQAFSQFKKWQQSGLQLLLAGAIDPGYSNIFHEKLNAYKYKHDVISIHNIPAEKPKLISAAFSLLSTGNSFDERMDIINAFIMGIPVLAHNAELSNDLCGDSALYANFTDPRDLSQQMISVYKNEGVYNHLVEKGKLTASRFNRQQLLNELNRVLLAAIEQ